MIKMLIEDIIEGLDALIRAGDAVITQEFGVAWVRNPKEMHNGIDIALPRRSPLDFPCTGKTTRASYHSQDDIHAYGNRVSFELADVDDIELYLAHMDGIEVQNNAVYYEGNIAGRSGTSGSSTGPHLHLGIRQISNGIYLDPRLYVDFSIFDRVKPDVK